MFKNPLSHWTRTNPLQSKMRTNLKPLGLNPHTAITSTQPTASQSHPLYTILSPPGFGYNLTLSPRFKTIAHLHKIIKLAN